MIVGYSETPDALLSFDVSCDGRVMCAGTETNHEKSSFLIFWYTNHIGNK